MKPSELIAQLQRESKGNSKAKTKFPEYEEQKKLISWWRGLKAYKLVPIYYQLICTDASAKRTLTQQARYKAMGGQAGTPDLFLAVPRDINNGLFIELKAPDRKPKRGGKGGLSEHQEIFLANLDELGYCTAVCYSAIEAQKIISEYLGLKL